MNEIPPVISPAPVRKSGIPTWAIVLIAVGGVGLVGIFLIGMLAAIAIPNFVKARETAQMNVCINNLRMIDAAKQQWALENKKELSESPAQSDLVAFLPGPFPTCPAGGIYALNSIGEHPTCSHPKHRLRDS